MDSCLGVEQDLDKALSKFKSLNDNSSKLLQNIIDQVEEIRQEITKHADDTQLTPAQAMLISDLAATVKTTTAQMSTDHRELHATVSRVGKSIDRHFIADYASVAPKAESFCNDVNRPIMEQAIAQHLYRQGLEDVGDAFVSEAKITGVERTCTFALLQRCAAALAEGDPSAALNWAERRAHELHNSPLPFTLHRMQALKLAREQGVGAAIEYARRQFPLHAARHERALQAAVCALAWCTPGAGPAPPIYQHLLDPKALGAEAAELFIKEACGLLRLAPLSPLAGGVLAGARVLPALHDIRSKMSHPHVIAAWSDDELPFEVDLGEDGGGYHSVFACPILRQQASEQNPPMRLLCGHVISRDALNKLAMGAKVYPLRLKCPYCPMEQSPSEARQIYFS
ncbi:E3 ubiquitin-protein ligase RMND5A isoform X2 [Spodoptera frugiperda]|uniref:E3 ubiquitin-protein ligase RMND5A isoform X2 n=1 Tax=Spodoptera frugiperda TaxID=7108 RepID=A0A9R0DN19_SPOFR|nr:E3 ubiquitin-protein ligase RMND5A isoform X2 [Spodoptera frugiperda]